jgi:3-hydroxyisobutyrate dehydrogenase
MRRGVEVSVFDPDPTVVGPRVAAGAREASSPADAARDVDAVCIVVRDDAQVLAVVRGPDGVLAGMGDDAVVVLHSTVAPGTVRTLDALCRERGVRFIDAAIGAARGRETGEMSAMCGGDEATIDAVRPVLSTYAKDIVRFGDLGAGMAAKLSRNMIQYSLWAVVHEGAALASAAGIDRDAFVELVRTSGVLSDDNAAMRAGGVTTEDPSGRLARTVTLAWKDLDDAFALADEVGMDTPMARLAKREIGPSVGLALTPD